MSLGPPSARFDDPLISIPPCMTTPKLLAASSDHHRHNELWPHHFFDLHLTLQEGSTWLQLSSSSTVPPSSPPPSANPNSPPLPKYPQLSIDELNASRPHPRSFFCPLEWRWLVVDILDDRYPPRPLNRLCDGSDYHFFQYFPASISAVHSFNPSPPSPFDPPPPSSSPALPPIAPEDIRWDARLCCRCKRGIFFTPLEAAVPSVFSDADPHGFTTHAKNYSHLPNHAQAPTRPEQLAYKAWHTVFIVVQNALLEGKLSPLPVNGKSISGRMPWDPISAKIWASLGIVRRESTEDLQPNEISRPLLVPPNLNVRTAEGRANRAKWVRALLELSVFLKWYKLQHQFVEECVKTNYVVPFQLVSALPNIAEWLGGDTIPKIPIRTSWQTTSGRPVGYASYASLGILPTVPDEVVTEAYSVQVEIYPHLRYDFFEALREIKGLRDGSCEALDVFLGIECSKGVVGLSEARAAWNMVVGNQHEMDLSREELMMEEFNLKNDAPGADQAEKSKLRDSLRVLVEANPTNELLRAILDSAVTAAEVKTSPMDLDKAYATLGDIIPEVDDGMLWMAYKIGVSDQPGQKDLLRAALEVIANHRNSQTIKARLALEMVGGDSSESMEVIPYSPPTVSYDLPAGLNNIGNTCYLNSLLQYFFSVRELRDVLLRFPEYEQDVEEEEMKDKKRVGGRIVSTPEIVRSKQFASQLQGLFHEMIHTPLSAVTPERELAFLALVLSKDESPQPVLATTHDSSASTDATLVDERPVGPVFNPPPSPAAAATVLGKRKSESSGSEDGRTPMELDEKTREEDVPMAGPTPAAEPEAEATKSDAEVIDLTGESAGPPPPLPPRPNRTRSLAVTDSGSHMMFGRQNDVSECMDNCLFQIQAALDERKLGATTRYSEHEGNIVKSLFYGRTRQSLVFESPEGKVSVKEEPFAYLLVDVAEEGRDLYDGLDRVFDESEVELENGKACRRVGLVDLPPILQIQLQRVQFDRRTHTVFKSNAHLKFDDRLRMERYLEPDPEDVAAQEKRAETARRRREIESLRGRAGELATSVSGDKRAASTVLRDLQGILSAPDAGGPSTRMAFFEGLLGDAELAYLEAEAAAIDAEVEANEASVKRLKAEVEEMWKAEDEQEGELGTSGEMEVVRGEEEEGSEKEKAKKAEKKKKATEYQLVSLFIHRGTAQGGHYWAIQRQLPDRPSRWLKYNDSQVSEVDGEREVFGLSDGCANPYWLTYVRVGEEDRFEMVRREVS